jgi:hypothetical protein
VRRQGSGMRMRDKLMMEATQTELVRA